MNKKRYAFDVDDTITGYPEQCKDIMEGLIAQGHVISIITGTIDEPKNVDLSKIQESRRIQLARHGVIQGIHYHDIHPAVGPTGEAIAIRKGQLCKMLGISAVWDDTAGYCSEILKACPNIMICQIGAK